MLEGELAFLVSDEERLPGPPGVVHTFSSGPGRSRLLNVHAPSSGFHDWLPENSEL